MNFAYLLYVVNNHRYNCSMRTVITAALFCLLNITLIPAQENENYSESSWLLFSDSSSNRIISEIIDKTDLTGKIDILQNLGKRKDRNFNLIIENIYYEKNGNKAEKEILLFYSLESMIKNPGDFEENSVICRKIFNDINIYSDSLLRKQIIKTADYADRKTAVKTLASEGNRLASISSKNGELDSILLDECRVFFMHCEKYSEAVLEQLKDIISRNAVNFNTDLENFKRID